MSGMQNGDDIRDAGVWDDGWDDDEGSLLGDAFWDAMAVCDIIDHTVVAWAQLRDPEGLMVFFPEEMIPDMHMMLDQCGIDFWERMCPFFPVEPTLGRGMGTFVTSEGGASYCMRQLLHVPPDARVVQLDLTDGQLQTEVRDGSL